MKISKQRLLKIIKEEIGREFRGYINEQDGPKPLTISDAAHDTTKPLEKLLMTALESFKIDDQMVNGIVSGFKYGDGDKELVKYGENALRMAVYTWFIKNGRGEEQAMAARSAVTTAFQAWVRGYNEKMMQQRQRRYDYDNRVAGW